MTTITEVPYEIWDHILRHNNHKDTKNLACCCRYLHTLLKPMVWRKVTIVYPKSASSLRRDDEYLQNLNYTEDLHFSSLPELCRTEEEILRFAQFTLHWGKLLSCFKPGKLRSLTFHGKNCFSFTLESLYYIRKIKLSSVNIDDWSGLGCLRNLVSISISQCNIKDDSFKALVNSNKLEKVVASRCRFLTSRCLESTEHLRTIKSFSFHCNGVDYGSSLALEACHFDGLKKITFLELGGVYLSDECLTWICENLKAIEVLNLSHMSGVTDEGFQSIQSLTSLQILDIEHCEGLSDGLFHYVESSASIRSLKFDANLCKRENVTYIEKSNLSERLTVLNKIKNLRELVIRVSNDFGAFNYRVAIAPSVGFDRTNDGLVTYILEVLCGNHKWSLRITTRSTLRVYQLTR